MTIATSTEEAQCDDVVRSPNGLLDLDNVAIISELLAPVLLDWSHLRERRGIGHGSIVIALSMGFPESRV